METNIGVADTLLDFLAHALANLDVNRVAQQIERLGQHVGGLGAEEIDGRGLVGRQHPGGLLADTPQIILDGVFEVRLAKEIAQRSRAKAGALAEIGYLVARAVTRAHKQAVVAIVGLGNLADLRHERFRPGQEQFGRYACFERSHVAARCLQLGQQGRSRVEQRGYLRRVEVER